MHPNCGPELSECTRTERIPDKMPQDLREAHARLDDIVESCYPGYPFASDEARLECLFKLYEKMTVSTRHQTKK